MTDSINCTLKPTRIQSTKKLNNIEEKISVIGEDVRICKNEDKCKDKLKDFLRNINQSKNLKTVKDCKWQGVIIKTIMEDGTLLKGNFDWLSRWKSCPTSTITELMGLLYQTLDTKCYRKHLTTPGNAHEVSETTCRLCNKGNESVKHLLSNCGMLVKKVYTKRHNDALKTFFFEVLHKFGFIDHIPPWFTNENIKPMYENDKYIVYWNIPEFSGKDGETLKERATPDGKIVLKKEKKIYLIEQTITWIANREDKFVFKKQKYEEIQTFLRLENPAYQVDQITLVMDVFGGFSYNLREQIQKVLDKDIASRVITKMQKSVISNEAHLSRVFKLRTKQ